MQYKIPQNIDLEDKIVGPLTIKQFLYMMTGGMIVYISFEVFQTGVFLLIAIPTGLLTLCLTFLKIQDQPFEKFFVSLLMYLNRPKKRLWDKIPSEERLPFGEKTLKKTGDEKLPAKKIEKSQLEILAQVLDTKGLAQPRIQPKLEKKTPQVAIQEPKNQVKPKKSIFDIFRRKK